MDRLGQKRERLARRVRKVRLTIRPRTARARMVFNQSNRFLSVQIVDDAKGVTVCAASTADNGFQGAKHNKEAAKKLGQLIAQRAKEKGVSKVVLDRRGRLYHGRIAAFAEAAREQGMEF